MTALDDQVDVPAADSDTVVIPQVHLRVDVQRGIAVLAERRVPEVPSLARTGTEGYEELGDREG